MRNSLSIGVELPVKTCDIYDALDKAGIQEPTREQVEGLAQFIRDEAIQASLAALKNWHAKMHAGGVL